MNSMHELREKLANLHEMNMNYLKEIKQRINELKLNNQFIVVGYFTYSFNLYHEKDYENLCIGSFHLHNFGAKPLTNPYICLKIASESPFEFSGKYVYKNSLQNLRLTQGWERMNDPSDKEEYWLRPMEKRILEPSEVLSFPNFQVKWQSNIPYYFNIEGYIYGDEIVHGVKGMNDISIKGTAPKEEEEDD